LSNSRVSSEAASRFTAEVVTPKYRATAPEDTPFSSPLTDKLSSSPESPLSLAPWPKVLFSNPTSMKEYCQVASEPTLYIKTKGGHTPEGEVEKIYWVCYLTCKKKETSCKEIRVSITKLKL
jgi:hypothetical protein